MIFIIVQMRVAGNVETCNQLKIRFNRFRNILRQSIKDAKRLYFQRIFEKFKHNIKNTWSTINEKLQRKKKKKHPAISSIMMVKY